MTWNFYANENMTTLFGSTNGADRLHNVVFNSQNQSIDTVIYFGNPEAGKVLEAKNAGESLTLTTTASVAAWQAQTSYIADQIVAANGYLFKVNTAGKSGTSAPRWLNTANSNTADGTVVWRCVGKVHDTGAVKLALSKDGLASGSPTLTLGTSIPSGAAVAVHLRLTNRVADLYDLAALVQLEISINEAVERAA